MAKTKTLVLCKFNNRYSPINTGMYINYTFLDTDTGLLLECAVDSNFRNFARWQSIVNDPDPIGIYSNLIVTKKRTKEGLYIISADSYPQLEERMTIDQLIEMIKMVLDK